MKSEIEDMYFYKTETTEFDFMLNKEYKEAFHQSFELYDKFVAGLSPEQFSIFDDFLDEENRLNGVEERLVFTEGFRFGARLMLEIFQNKLY